MRRASKQSPAARMAFGLVVLMVSLVLVADQIGLIPDGDQAIFDARKKVIESLAVQFAAVAPNEDIAPIETTLRALVERNSDVLSAALRNTDGVLVVEAGQHQAHWPKVDAERGAATHTQVPIFKGSSRWATVEIHFTPIRPAAIWFNPRVRLIAFIMLVGYLVYYLFLRRTLRYLDPSAVIPARVKAAMDTMTEGVLILDERENIVLANAAFADKMGQRVSALVGRNPAELQWRRSDKDAEAPQAFPWRQAVKERKNQIGVPLSLSTPAKGVRTFMVNGAPILDGQGKVRGTMATFDDVTEVEKKNVQLQRMLHLLENSQTEVKRKNQKLEFLATRDPLTGCLNRRSFFPKLNEDIEAAQEQSRDLACIMVDIDNFKSVNDQHGHSTGDKVIRLVAQTLRAGLRSGELVCRYGGEEFCVFLPGTDIEQACTVAERLRVSIASKDPSDVGMNSAAPVTVSLGVSSLHIGAGDSAALIEQADQALYAAKAAGRNRVMRWDDDKEARQTPQAADVMEVWSDENHDQPSISVSELGAASPADVPAKQESLVERLKNFVKDLQYTVVQRTRELEHQQGHDALTGLPNRVLLDDRVRQAIARARRHSALFAVMVLNINHFKRVNDSLGYAGGDRLLKEVAERLARALRPTDSVARIIDAETGAMISRRGGDDFGLLLTDLDKLESVAVIAERIIELLADPVLLDGHEIYVTCSIGISAYPRDGDTPDALLNKADIAMRHGKLQSGNSYQFYAEDMDSTSLAQVQLESELRRAVANEEFLLHYQPKVDLRTGKITGFEALIRWQHPELGMVPPFQFIPVAEYTGVIQDIGLWVLREACRQAKSWIEAGFSEATIAVNVSALQLREKHFVDQVVSILEEIDLPPQHLELEITESTIMEDVETAIDILNTLHEAGIRLAIDDFGTGYSSLSYIKRLPIDTVKVDRSFVNDLTADSTHNIKIVSAIISMAHDLELKVVAEGVETEQQLAFLNNLHCDEMQGYFFSRPIPAADASELLTEHVPSPCPCPPLQIVL